MPYEALQSQSDEALMMRVRDRDCDDSFDVLVERHRPQDLRIAVGLLYQSAAVDSFDAVQNKNIKIWQQRSSYQTGQSFAAWNFAILRNCVRDLNRKERLRMTEQLGEKLSQDGGTSAEFDEIERLEDCLKRMDMDRQLHIVLKNFAEFSFSKIAEVVKSSESTAWRRHKEAISFLHDCIGE